MTIMVIGEGIAAMQSLRGLESSHNPVRSCRTLQSAVGLLRQRGTWYSLVLAEDDGTSPDTLQQAIADTGCQAPVVVINTPADADAAHGPRPSMCMIERREDGSHRLRCAMNRAPAPAAASTHAVGPSEDHPPAVFAYSAPCQGRRRSHYD